MYFQVFFKTIIFFRTLKQQQKDLNNNKKFNCSSSPRYHFHQGLQPGRLPSLPNFPLSVKMCMNAFLHHFLNHNNMYRIDISKANLSSCMTFNRLCQTYSTISLFTGILCCFLYFAFCHWKGYNKNFHTCILFRFMFLL